MENKSALIASHLSHTFIGEHNVRLEVLHDLSFEVARGSFLSIVGPSGGGKSTLLRILAGLMRSNHGIVRLGVATQAMIFQNFAIFPWLTVRENIEFGLKMRGVSLTKRHHTVAEKIAEVGLLGFEHKYPKELSGGMRQRVGIARALAISPELLLMDEPFSSLDTFTAEKLRNDLHAIWLKYKMTIVMVTHLVSEAIELSDRILVLSKRPAHVKLDLDVKLPRPRNHRSQEFYALEDKITAEIEN